MRAETVAIGLYLFVISLVTWLLTLWSPFTGFVMVGGLGLGLLLYMGKKDAV
jgi:hypothetical protein